MSPSVAFPIRINQGLLKKTSEREAYLHIIEVMAKTPRGSWPGHNHFGFNQLFQEATRQGITPEARTAALVTAAKEVNQTLAELGLTEYTVDAIQIDLPVTQGLQGGQSNSAQREKAANTSDTPAFVLLLRESGAGTVFEHVL